MTPTRSPIARASSWSWVTNSVVMPIMIWMRRISSRSWRRTLASSADSGSSRRSTLGSIASARASATRCCWPPDIWCGIAARLLAEPDELEHLVGLALARRAVDAAQSQPVGDVVAGRHVREQAVRLEDDPHVPLVRRNVGDVLAVDQDPALVHVVEPAERSEGRRLAAAGRSEQRDQLAGGDVDGQPVQGVDRAVPAVHVLERDGDAVSVRGDGSGSWSVMRRAPRPDGWSRRAAPATRVMTTSRTNAKMRAENETATEMNGSCLPSRKITTWSVLNDEQRGDRVLAEDQRDRQDRGRQDPAADVRHDHLDDRPGQPAPRLRAASASVAVSIERRLASIGAVGERQDEDDVDECEGQRRRADRAEVLAHEAIDRGDADDDDDRRDGERQEAQELDHAAHARDTDDRPDHRRDEQERACPTTVRTAIWSDVVDAVDQVLVLEDRGVGVQGSAAEVAARRELEHREERQDQVAEDDDEDRDAGDALAARQPSAPAAALRCGDQRPALGRGSRQRCAGRAGHFTHRDARRWIKAYRSHDQRHHDDHPERQRLADVLLAEHDLALQRAARSGG